MQRFRERAILRRGLTAALLVMAGSVAACANLDVGPPAPPPPERIDRNDVNHHDMRIDRGMRDHHM